jgi:hypothetical protein
VTKTYVEAASKHLSGRIPLALYAQREVPSFALKSVYKGCLHSAFRRLPPAWHWSPLNLRRMRLAGKRRRAKPADVMLCSWRQYAPTDGQLSETQWAIV